MIYSSAGGVERIPPREYLPSEEACPQGLFLEIRLSRHRKVVPLRQTLGPSVYRLEPSLPAQGLPLSRRERRGAISYSRRQIPQRQIPGAFWRPNI